MVGGERTARLKTRVSESEEETRKTSFLEILLYVGGSLAVIALLALVAVWLLKAL